MYDHQIYYKTYKSATSTNQSAHVRIKKYATSVDAIHTHTRTHTLKPLVSRLLLAVCVIRVVLFLCFAGLVRWLCYGGSADSLKCPSGTWPRYQDKADSARRHRALAGVRAHRRRPACSSARDFTGELLLLCCCFESGVLEVVLLF